MTQYTPDEVDKLFWFNYPHQEEKVKDPDYDSSHIMQKLKEFRRGYKAALSRQAAETGKDHNIREFVIDLVKTSNTYSGTGQLRERLVDIVYAHLKLLPTYERANKDAEIERLKAELAECREDAERLDWLDKQNKNLEIDKWVVLGNDCTGEDDYKKYWVGADLRKAIDQARKESE